MAANIGKINVMVTATTLAYDAAMKKAAATAKATGGAIQGTLKTVGGGGIQKFAGAIQTNFEAALNPLSYAMSQLKGWATMGLASGGWGVAVAAALQLILIPLGLIAATLAIARERFKFIKQLGDSAARAGTEIGQFQLITQVLGDDIEKAEKTLFMFNRTLGTLALQGPEAFNALSRLGLTAQDLQKMGPAEAFRAIIGGLQKISNEATRAAIAQELFKRSGRDALGIVNKGGTAFIDKQAALIDRFGLAVNESSYASIKQVMAAEKTISLFRSGISNQIGLGVAPILAEIAAQLTTIELKTSGITENTIQAGEVAGFTTALLIESGKALGGLVGIVVLIFHQASLGAIKLYGLILSMGKALAELTGNKSMAKYFADAEVEANKAKNKTLANRDRTADTLGDLWGKFGSSFAANREFFEKVRERLNKIKEDAKKDNVFDVMARNAERAGKIIEANMADPFGSFMKSAREVVSLIRDVAVIPGLGEKNIFDILGKPNAGFQALGTEFQKLTQGRNQPGFAGAAQIGSLEAYKAIITSRADPQLDVLETIKQIQKERLELEKTQVEIGEKVYAALTLLGKDLSIF